MVNPARLEDDARPGTPVRFSVVVPAFDEEAVLGSCLAALRRQTYPGAYEVLVVDNGSTDRTSEIALAAGARVLAEPQRGVCFARQRGLEEAVGEVVVSTDADTVVGPDWLRRIDEAFVSRPGAVAVAGPCTYTDGPWWGRVWGWLLFGVVALVARLTGFVGYVTATNLAFRRDALDGYDTRLTQGGDELDVLRRLRRRGRVVFVRDNTVSTSARRLRQGLLRSLVVSLLVQYALTYLLDRLLHRPVLGTAPVFRPTAPLTEHRPRTRASRRPGRLELRPGSEGGADR